MSALVQLQYNDAGGKPPISTGPMLNERSEGILAIIIAANGTVEWHPRLLPNH